MEWILIILGIIAYLMIGGFIDGLFDADMEWTIVIWPVILVVTFVMVFVNIAREAGLGIMEAIESRKEETE